MKKYLKILIALAVTFGSAFNVDIFNAEQKQDKSVANSVEQEIVVPDLSNYEMPSNLLPDEKQPDNNDAEGKLELLPQRDSNAQYGFDGQFDVPEGAELVNSDRLNSQKQSRFVAPANVGDRVEMFDLFTSDPTDKITLQLAASNNDANVLVRVAQSGDADYDSYMSLKPNGTTPSSDALAIVNEFTFINGLATETFGEKAGDWKDSKINIVLYDIGQDGNRSSSYVAGFFSSADFFANGGSVNSNENTIVYLDNAANQGWNSFTRNDGLYFYETLIHEYQHLLNATKYYSNYQNLKLIGDDSYRFVSTWLNEGLSGLAGSKYIDAKSNFSYNLSFSHLVSALMNDFDRGVGYVPSASQWRSTSRVLANYGISNLLIQELLATSNVSNAIPNVMTSDYVGNMGSIYTVAKNYDSAANINSPSDDYMGAFNDFFTKAILNISVDNPDGVSIGSNPVYSTNAMDNAWLEREVINIAYSDYLTYLPMIENTDIPYNSNDAGYFSRVYLANQSIGANSSAVEITIPDSNAQYFIVTPHDSHSVNDIGGWIETGKIVGKLNPGVNSVVVGTDNLFAIVAVTTNAITETETFSYVPLKTITEATNSIETPTLGATPQATITAGADYTGTISWAEKTKTALTGGFEAGKAYVATVTLTANEGAAWDTAATITVDNADATVSGVSVSADGKTLTYNATFPVVPAKLSSLELSSVPFAGMTIPETENTDLFTSTIVWTDAAGNVATGVFEEGTVYTAEYTVTSLSPYYIDETITNITVTKDGVTGVVSDIVAQAEEIGNSVTFTATFEATAMLVSAFDTTVAIPVYNEVAQTTIEGTEEYSATITWSPELLEGGMFNEGTVYTASIVITPAQGYAFASADNATPTTFVVNGASVEAVIENGVATITVPFAKTIDVITEVPLDALVAQPIVGAEPQLEIGENEFGIIGTIEWASNGAPFTGTFENETVYNATVTLDAVLDAGYIWGDVVPTVVTQYGTVIQPMFDETDPELVTFVVTYTATDAQVVEPEAQPEIPALPESGMQTFYLLGLVLVLLGLGARKVLNK